MGVAEVPQWSSAEGWRFLPEGEPFKIVGSQREGQEEEKGLLATYFGTYSGPDHTGRDGRTWILHRLSLGDVEDATAFAYEGPKENCIIRKVGDKDKVALEVNERNFEHGSPVWLWNDAPAVPAEYHSRFAIHEDGRISAHLSTPGRVGEGDFVLGIDEFGSVVLVPRGHPTELLVRPKAIGAEEVPQEYKQQTRKEYTFMSCIWKKFLSFLHLFDGLW